MVFSITPYDLHSVAIARRERRSQSRHGNWIAEWVRQHGMWCPGAAERGHAPHYVETRRDLSIDHIVPSAQGGPDIPSNKRVLCKAENHAKADEWPEGYVRD